MWRGNRAAVAEQFVEVSLSMGIDDVRVSGIETVLLRFTLAPSELRRADSCKQNCVSYCLDYTYAIRPVRIARRQDCNDRYLKGFLRTSPRNGIAQVHVLQHFMQLAQPYCWTYLSFVGHLPNG